MKKLIIAIAFASALTISSKPAMSTSIIGATEPTQILNNVQLVLQVIEQINTYRKLIDQYENMLENTEKWEEMFWGRGMDMMLELGEAVTKDEILAYTSETLHEDFLERFPGYDEYLAEGIDGWDADKISEEHARWNLAQRSNIEAALESTALHNKEFETEEELIEGLKLQAETAIGRNQALQAANQIAVEGLRQNQKLRQLVMTQIQLQGNYQAYESSQTQAKRALADLHRQGLIDQGEALNPANGDDY